MGQDTRLQPPTNGLSDLEKVEHRILQYLRSQGRVWTLVGATPEWSQRFEDKLWNRLSGLLVDMALRGYFDLPPDHRATLARLQHVQRVNRYWVPQLRGQLERAFVRGMEVLLTTTGERRLDELDRAISARIQGPQGATRVTVNISGGVVAALNAGTIVGNLNASVTSLQEAGQAEVARALQHLAEEIARTDELGDRRTALLELVDALGEVAADPIRRRRTIAGSLLASLQQALGNAANLATVWATWGPVLTRFFGLKG